MSRRVAFGLLLLLAALLPVRAEASRASVWESTPPTSLTATGAEQAGMLASLAPAAADVEITEAPRFDLGDVDLVESELEHEDRFGLGPLDLLGPTPLRGPPSSYPETRVGGFELLPPFRIGASPTLSLWSRRACGSISCGLASDSPEDPWGLRARRKSTQVPQVSGAWNVPSGSFAPAPVGVDAPGYIPGGVVETASVTTSGDPNVDLADLHSIGLSDEEAAGSLGRRYPAESHRTQVGFRAVADGVKIAAPVALPALEAALLFSEVMAGEMAFGLFERPLVTNFPSPRSYQLGRAKGALGKVPGRKTVSADAAGGRTVSGWKPRAGFDQRTAEVMAKAEEIGHPLRRHRLFDQGTPGQYYASHAEKQKMLNMDDLAVSRPMCSDCQDFASRLAKAEGREIVVTDPNATRLFGSDGVTTILPRPE